MPDAYDAYLLDLYGSDPFAEVRDASEAHRLAHARSLPGGEQECGIYPSNPLKMRVVCTITRGMAARRILEIGAGFGYSALWLAHAAGRAGRVETIDRFPEHVSRAREFAEQFRLAGRVIVLEGEGEAVLGTLAGPYDLVHDDGWFAQQPPYYDLLAGLLRPGGVLLMSNWFLLEHAVTGDPPVDWSQFAGPAWAEDVKAYARRLVADDRYDVSFVPDPALALAYRR